MPDEASSSVEANPPEPQNVGEVTTNDTTAGRMFSQADVDRIVQDRVARVKAAPPADYEELKSKAQKLAELEAESQTELERAQARAEEAEKQVNDFLAEVKETRLRSAIIAEAARPERKVVDPEAVIALLDRSTLELDDSGIPTNIAKAMDSLLEKRPYLVVQDGGARGNADQGARTGGVEQLTESEYQSMSPEQKVQARKEGRLVGLGIGS